MPKRGKKRINKQVQKPRLTKNEKNEANASASIISTVTAELLEPPVKSLMDDNNYRVIKLANGLTAMLVSCPQHEYSKVTYTSLPEKQKNGSNGATDKVSFEEEDPGWSQRMKEKKRCITKVAYFELCVTVGSFNDPREVPGASSILSKILLKKSKKYSDENDDLGSWLLHRDASARIYGYAEKTVYSFETQLKHLTETLDRFAQNLISPLILPAEVERIRNDILHYSELELKGMMAPGPKQYLFYNLLSPRHSARVYGRDYLEGLRQPNEDEVYKEVVNFRERHYSAHRMTIVLKAELSLDTLEGYIKEYFSKIPNNDQPLNEFNQFNFLNSFERSKYGRLYKLNSYVPVDVAEFSLFGLRKKPTKRLLMESIAKLIGDWSNLITNDLFETTKKRVLAAYEERILENLMTQNLTEDLRLSILKVGHWTRMDKHAALSTIQMLRFQGFVKQFFHYVYVKCLAQGNITSEDVSTNVQKFIAISKCGSLSPNMSLQVKIVEIPIGEKYCRIQNFVEKCTTVIVSNYYQSPIHNTEAILKVDLLTSIITDELFEELRQCVELESIGSQICHDEGVVGYNIVMWEVLQEEEKSKTPQELDVDIEDHRATLHSLFGQITDKEWGDILDVFMDHKKLPRDSKHLVSEVTRNWGEITAGTYLFNREEHDLNAIKKMTIEDVRRWMLFLTSRGGKIQKLSVQVDCAGPPETATSSQHKYSLKYKCGLHKPMVEGRQFINCIPTFKSSLKVLPRPDTP